MLSECLRVLFGGVLVFLCVFGCFMSFGELKRIFGFLRDVVGV